MATKLRKTVVREVEDYDGRGHSLMVSLQPGGVLSFREKGTRKSFDLTVGAAYVAAVKRTVDLERAEKNKGRTKVKRF
jgi:hypothetical protein